MLRPKTQLEPDILVFRSPVGGSTWEAVQEHLLAVETASRWTVISIRDFKRPADLDLGVGEVWRVDLDNRVVLVTKPGESPDVAYGDEVRWSPKGLGRSFRVEVEPLFRGLP